MLLAVATAARGIQNQSIASQFRVLREGPCSNANAKHATVGMVEGWTYKRPTKGASSLEKLHTISKPKLPVDQTRSGQQPRYI